MENQCITFNEAIERANYFVKQYPDYNEINLLLGNGFSIDCCKNIFTYKSLFENAIFSDNIKNIFSVGNTNDFEKVIHILQESSSVCEIYNFDTEQVQQLNTDAEIIKEELIKVLSTKHPLHQHKISDNQFCSAYKFLSNFTKIYTLNYDMLLYWTLMLKEREPEILKEFNIKNMATKDGFGKIDNKLSWYKTNKQNIFYVHGALHLFDNGVNIIKAETSLEDNLMDVIKNNLKNNQYPLIVTEGSSEQKMNKISHNKYLQNTIDNLKYTKGCLFIHGHSLDENDKHIFNIIKNCRNLKKIFISVFNPNENFDEIQQRALSIFVDGTEHAKDIDFYDAETAGIWNSISQEEYSKKEFKLLAQTNKMKFF